MTAIEIYENTEGSKTLLNTAMNETYHSRHGAIAESMHVFINMGLNEFRNRSMPAETLHIFEMGFGTGLNAILTLQNQKQLEKIAYESVETFPLAYETVDQLDYTKGWDGALKDHFKQIHKSTWGEWQGITPNFNLLKRAQSLSDMPLEKNHYHLIYFDAFAPDKQPELWTIDIFTKLFQATKPGGILVTYAAKGEVRRAMMAAGFSVEKLEGPPYKRHMLRATKLPLDA